MFNRMLASRNLLYKQAGGEETDLCSANDEIIRTLQIISRQDHAKKCKKMPLMLKRVLKAVLNRGYEFSYAQIDAILSLFPELAPRKVSLGATCLDLRDGETVITVLGSSSTRELSLPLH